MNPSFALRAKRSLTSRRWAQLIVPVAVGWAIGWWVAWWGF